MQKKSWLVLVALFLSSVSCGPRDPDRDRGGSQSTVVQQILNFFGPSPTASPSPGAGGGVVSRVHVSEFGEERPVGGAPAGTVCLSDQPRLGQNCAVPVTCTPKDSQGRDVAVDAAPGSPDSFLLTQGVGGACTWTITGAGGYNGELRGIRPGRCQLTCKVNGVSSDTTDPGGPYTVEVQ